MCTIAIFVWILRTLKFSEETINHSHSNHNFAWMKRKTTKNYHHTWKFNFGDLFLTFKILKKEKTVKLKEEEENSREITYNRQSNIYT